MVLMIRIGLALIRSRVRTQDTTGSRVETIVNKNKGRGMRNIGEYKLLKIREDKDKVLDRDFTSPDIGKISLKQWVYS